MDEPLQHLREVPEHVNQLLQVRQVVVEQREPCCVSPHVVTCDEAPQLLERPLVTQRCKEFDLKKPVGLVVELLKQSVY